MLELPRPLIIAAANSWIGTPYHHQASRKGVGCDCLGLVRGLYRELLGEEPEQPPPYSRDWAEASGTETLLTAAARHLSPIAIDAAAPADILVFRLRAASVAKHIGILVDNDRMVHAEEHRGVEAIAYSSWWRRRTVAAFMLPGAIG